MDKGINDPKDQREIAGYMLSEFKAALNRVAMAADGILTVVDTHNTVGKEEWLNEIHPTSEGFKKVAQKIFEKGIKPLL